MLKMTADELTAFIDSFFPAMSVGFKFKLEDLDEERLRMRMFYDDLHLRPGGTISGPSLMTLADTAIYLLLLARIGPVALAVTTNLNINFLRKPAPADVIAEAHLLKLGSRLAVGEVEMFSDGEREPVAHAVLTYSIPPRSS